MAILSCHVSIKLPPKISDGQKLAVTRLDPPGLANTLPIDRPGFWFG